MAKTRVLVVDDDPAISRLLSTNLKARGYEVITAVDGAEALEAMDSEIVDLVILDIMMPKVDGVEVCRCIREWSRVPIIMLSAMGDEKGKVNCLELGADDYLTKPFGMAELIARVNTAMRHADTTGVAPMPSNFTCGELEINFPGRRVTINGTEVKLTPTEYSLLQHMVANVDRVLTHSMLLQKVWGEEYYSEKEYLRVFIGRLRKKIEANPEKPKYIVTVPGVGYHFAQTS